MKHLKHTLATCAFSKNLARALGYVGLELGMTPT
jgi:hypothetical protein